MDGWMRGTFFLFSRNFNFRPWWKCGLLHNALALHAWFFVDTASWKPPLVRSSHLRIRDRGYPYKRRSKNAVQFPHIFLHLPIPPPIFLFKFSNFRTKAKFDFFVDGIHFYCFNSFRFLPRDLSSSPPPH